MRRVAAALLLALLLPPASSPARGGDGAGPKDAPPRDVSALLAPILGKHGIPGMAGAIVDGERVSALGASGVREAGKDAMVTTADRWHLGSCTKAMTATLCAMLVEEGKLRWDSTVGEAFKDLPRLDPAWQPATLEQLCVQRAGAPPDLTADGLWGRLWQLRGTPEEQRRVLAEGVLAKPPLHAPGSKYLYANANYALAGIMAERAAGKPWEDLLRERLFRPLGMDSAGYGAPGTAKGIDQPRGHGADGKPVPPGPGADNPASIGPAGTVHASITDWAKFVSLHLEGERGNARLLKPGTFRKLHAAPPEPGTREGYAMGWEVKVRPWSPGCVLTHSGTNTMWYCVTWVAPERDFAVLVCSNRGGDDAASGCDEAAWALVQDREAHPPAAPPPAGR
jgi:CubicO group peptidase (beta-lactamase class C family)